MHFLTSVVCNKNLACRLLYSIGPEAKNLNIHTANETHVIGVSNITFYSYSFLEVDGPKDALIEIYDLEDNLLGYSVVEKLNIHKGFNELEVSVILIQSPNLNSILSKYLDGNVNHLKMKGPINSTARVLTMFLSNQ
eukprot:UN04722